MLELIVTQKYSDAEGVCVLELSSAGPGALPPFEAGAHIDVQVKPGLVRQYSLCNPPWERDKYRIAVLRANPSRGGSIGIHELVHVGQRLLIGPPRNLFPLMVGSCHSVLIGAGIGITPLLSMAYQLHQADASFVLHYFARSRACAAFVDELQNSVFAKKVSLHFSDDQAANRQTLAQILVKPNPQDSLYVCGPDGFIQCCLEGAKDNRWRPDQTHHESFIPLPSSTNTGADGCFEVELASNGQVHLVRPDQSIYQVLDAAGIDLMVSCERGICGSCAIRVVEGEPDHRDQVLSEEERREQHLFTPCCSRALSARLVLDL